MQALATDDVDFQAEIISQLGNASAHDGKVSERELNFMVAVIKGIQPKEQVETMLAAQMAAEELDVAFERHAEAYRRIFERCGLRAIAVEASSGAMGGSESIEFMSVSEAGED
jgi:hypothetical protein